jgi:UDP-glucose 4-epimerase
VSKYAGELDLSAAKRMCGLDHVIVRPHNVYGERQNIADKYRNVIGIFMNALLNGQPMPVFGDGLQTRALSHVADVAPIIARSPLVQAARNRTQRRRGPAVHGARAGRGGRRRARVPV